MAGVEEPQPSIRFDTKIALILRDDLLPWQSLNMAVFLASGIAATHPELIGEPYSDADGTTYTPMFGQPVLVLQGDAAVIKAAHERAVSRGMTAAVFTAELFGTGHDAANRAVVAATPAAELDLVGLAVHGAKNAVDKVTKGARMHP
jgi:hypothetical protein